MRMESSNGSHNFILSKLFNLPQFYSSAKEYVSGINREHFKRLALDLFRYQHAHNALYRQYCDMIGCKASAVTELIQIPFLPISFFKSQRVQTGTWEQADLIFESSGTTGEIPSRHYVRNVALYECSLLRGFIEVFGAVEDWTILALLPSYLERKNASLVHMAKTLMKFSNQEHNGFYLNEWELLKSRLLTQQASGKKTLLLGVTFALLDFASDYPMDLSSITVMETGGMKGRREEWTREQVHELLKLQWNLNQVATEYGMTELLSQAYAAKEGQLKSASTMQVLVRETNDPLSTNEQGAGILNIIDLANVDSCAFIATEDMGRIYEDGSFEVLGRMDHAALRGCSLMHV